MDEQSEAAKSSEKPAVESLLELSACAPLKPIEVFTGEWRTSSVGWRRADGDSDGDSHEYE